MAFSFPRTRNGNILLKNGKVIDCCCGCILPPFLYADYLHGVYFDYVESILLTYDADAINSIGETGSYSGEFEFFDGSSFTTTPVELYFDTIEGEWRIIIFFGPALLLPIGGDASDPCDPYFTTGEFADDAILMTLY